MKKTFCIRICIYYYLTLQCSRKEYANKALFGSVNVLLILILKTLKDDSKSTLFSFTLLYSGVDRTLEIYESFFPVYNLDIIRIKIYFFANISKYTIKITNLYCELESDSKS